MELFQGCELGSTGPVKPFITLRICALRLAGALAVVASIVLTSSCSHSVGEIVAHKNAGDEAYVAGNYTEAERHYRAALKKAESSDPDHVMTLICLRSLAQVYVSQNRMEEAEVIYLKRIKILKEVPKDSTYAATVYDDLATFYILSRRVKEAKSLYEQAIALTEIAYGTDDQKVLEKLQYYETLLRAKNYEAEALELQKRATSRSTLRH